ncbi:MAG: cytochrome c [bacterium]
MTKTLILGLVMVGGIALAQSKATDPDVKARQTIMDHNGGAMKVLVDMIKGATPFDAAAADAAKATLVEDAAAIPAAWTVNATDPESHSKPEIWTNMEDFTAKAGALGTAAAALDTTSLDGIKAGMDALGGACGACHKAYKAS